jgi:hypothetical protein
VATAVRYSYYVQLVAIKRGWMRVANLKSRSARLRGGVKLVVNITVLHANARWASIRFKELIAIYGCYRGLRGLLESLVGMQLRSNLYRGVGADILSIKRY